MTTAALPISMEPLNILTQRVLDEAHRLHESAQGSPVTPQRLTNHVQKIAEDLGVELPAHIIEAATHRVLNPPQTKALVPTTMKGPVGLDWNQVALTAEARATAALKLLPEKYWRAVDTRTWRDRLLGRRPTCEPIRVSGLFALLGIEWVFSPKIAEFMQVVAPSPWSHAQVWVNQERVKTTRPRYDRCMYAHALGHLLLGHAACTCQSEIYMPAIVGAPLSRQGLPEWRPAAPKPRLSLAAYEGLRETHRVRKQEDEAAYFMLAVVLPEEVFERDLRLGIQKMSQLAERYDMYTNVISLRWRMLANKKPDVPPLIYDV